MAFEENEDLYLRKRAILGGGARSSSGPALVRTAPERDWIQKRVDKQRIKQRAKGRKM